MAESADVYVAARSPIARLVTPWFCGAPDGNSSFEKAESYRREVIADRSPRSSSSASPGRAPLISPPFGDGARSSRRSATPPCPATPLECRRASPQPPSASFTCDDGQQHPPSAFSRSLHSPEIPRKTSADYCSLARPYQAPERRILGNLFATSAHEPPTPLKSLLSPPSSKNSATDIRGNRRRGASPPPARMAQSSGAAYHAAVDRASAPCGSAMGGSLTKILMQPPHRAPALQQRSEIERGVRTGRLARAGPALPSFWINVWPCYGNCSSHCQQPVRLLVPARCYYIESVLQAAASLAQCRPAPHCLFEVNGHPIRRLDELIPEQHYLIFPCGGFYRRSAIPSALLWKLKIEARQALMAVIHRREQSEW